MTASDRKPAWLVLLIIAATMAGTAVAFALIFGSIHTLIIAAVLVVPVLLSAGVLYLFARSSKQSHAS